jgi:transcriptional regulator GlxA family with amidase domain
MQNLTKKNPSGVLFQIEPALKYLEENYTKEIKIEYLAELCGYSQSRFFSLFKNAVNCSPITYKNTLTIQKAIELLENTNKPIEEISESLGFESTRYFRKIFKNITGKTPRELR